MSKEYKGQAQEKQKKYFHKCSLVYIETVALWTRNQAEE